MDSRAQQAREHHRKALDAKRTSARHLEQRDALVRALYADGGWSYPSLAAAIGCTPEVIAKIINPQRR